MKDGKKYDSLEVSRILGEPRDPRKPYTMLQNIICETASADPEDYVYTFDVTMDTDKVYIVTSSGELTQESVTPESPVAVSFIDVSSPEYWIKITDLAKKKEDVLARKTVTVNRAMNAYENYLIINAINGSVQTANQFSLTSGKTGFTFENLIDMMDAIQDYGDKFILIAGFQIAKDILLWDWTENKYHSLKEALANLNIEVLRVNQVFSLDGETTHVLASDKAFLVATDTEVGKPLFFVRKKLDSIEMLGGVISEPGDMPERLIITSTNPQTVTAVNKRYLAVGVTGFEEVAIAVQNPYALASFTRS